MSSTSSWWIASVQGVPLLSRQKKISKTCAHKKAPRRSVSGFGPLDFSPPPTGVKKPAQGGLSYRHGEGAGHAPRKVLPAVDYCAARLAAKEEDVETPLQFLGP